MGVKLKELLSLPSLREAQVITGWNSLNKSITSLSFLEVSDMTFFSEHIQTEHEYYGGELLIGSFYTIRNDRAKQCEAIRHLHRLGEVGIILYYVGIVLPELSEEVIRLAEELDFVIIQMPENNSTIRYNEAIVEIMAAILNASTSESLLNEVLEKVSLLPEHLRSVEITLKMLSDLLRVNIVLTDREHEVINQILWPRNSSLAIGGLLEAYRVGGGEALMLQEMQVKVYHREIFHKDNGLLNLYLLKENGVVSDTQCEHAVEVLQVALNLWGKKHGEVSEYALVEAILNDESEKMYRLASILALDIRSVQMMWLVQLRDLRKEKELRQELEDHLSKHYQTHVIQLVENRIVVLLGNFRHNHSEFEISKEFLRETFFEEVVDHVVVCPKMRNTTHVRKTYQLVNRVTSVLSRVFPEKKSFSLSEIKQTALAQQQMQTGEREIDEQLFVLEPIRQNPEYIETLCTFLLDADSDFQRCGELLFIHKNTVKYRIRKISELLGYDMTRVSEAYEGYLACLLLRLIHG